MAKPKPKSDEEKKAALDLMLSQAATSNHLDTTPTQPENSSAAQPVSDTTADLQLQNEEQKGEKVLPALPPEPTATASVAPEPTAPSALNKAPALASEPTPAPTPKSAPQPAPPASAENEPASTVEAPKGSETTNFDISSLFEKSPTDKKTWVTRITEQHREYLSLLGTSVGGGASIPDMVHNIISQYIKANDAELQKALHKKLRQRLIKK
jgi:hypothetical protein